MMQNLSKRSVFSSTTAATGVVSTFLLLHVVLLSFQSVVLVRAEDILVNLPRIQLQMRCNYDIRKTNVNVTAELEAYFTETIIPKESISKWQIQGFPDISGQENVWPPCDYESSKVIMTAQYSGYAYIDAALGLTEDDIGELVTSESLYDYFFLNVCQYEIDDWVAVINDPTFSTTSDGRLICPYKDNDTARVGVIVASTTVGVVLVAALVLFLGYRYYSSNKKKGDDEGQK